MTAGCACPWEVRVIPTPFPTPKRGLPFWAAYFVKILVISYLLMRFILYGTGVLAYFFVHKTWKFF